MVKGLGSRVKGLGSRVEDLGFRVLDQHVILLWDGAEMDRSRSESKS